MRNLNLLLYILTVLTAIGCKKILDVKPDKSLVVPSTLQDMQAMLDFPDVMNLTRPGGSGEASADNYYLIDDNFNSLSLNDSKKLYTWSSEAAVSEVRLTDWFHGYRSIYYANVVLEGLLNLKDTMAPEYYHIKGAALFFRALSFYEIATLYCLPYRPGINDAQLGLPLRLSPDINRIYARSSLKETYDRITHDLIVAVDLLPVEPYRGFKTRPTKPAAYALLARIHLFTQEYDKALMYSNKALELYDSLLDFNTDINAASATAPIKRFNKETIFYAHTYDRGILNFSRAFIDTMLLRQYDDNDIRKTAYFRTLPTGTIFKGTYVGDRFQLVFTGLTTGELYLIRAECHARAGNSDQAMADLNTLLIKRWKNNGSFVPSSAIDSLDALSKILVERRKELVFRGLRWTDLKRLNMDPRFAITLKRVVNGETYTLAPNDKKYLFSIPDVVVKASGITQN